ncbi:von Willebrand factor type A domain-containing protein, partial [Corynascus novoguineensis]
MSTPWHRWNSPAKIFTAGISWNPLEPLPFELQNNNHITTGEHTNGGFPYFPGHDAGTAHTGGPLPVPATLSIANPIKSATTGPVVGPNGKGTGFPSFTVQEPGRNVLPPLSVTVDASIVQDTAKVAVTQLFWNDSDVPIKEAAFTFPLPAGCTVTDFSCRIGINKIIKGTVKPRQEARDQFRHHIRDHNTAAGLLEQDTPEIFTTTLGNVPKWTKVKINLIYITVLKHRFASSRSTTTLILPTSIAPRYGEAPEEYSDAKATDVSRGLTVEIEIVESERITSISSPSHAIAVQRQQGSRTAKSFADLAGEDGKSCVTVETASVKLEKGPLFLDKDFVLDIVTDPNGDNENPQAWLEQHPTLSNHKTLMLTLPPGYLNRSAAPMQRSEILFLADRSGSMEDKIPALKSAMQFFLKGIPEHRKFNIWSFGSHYTSWQPASVDYTEETLSSALSYVETNIRADMGGTELLPAIEATIEKRDRTMMTDVIILTDGEVWRLEESLEYVQKTRHRTEGQVRFFSLGIGNMVSHALVDGIAMTGGGYSEVVQEASQGGWEDRVVSMTKAALLSAHLGPTHLSFDIQDENGRTRSSTLAEAKRSPADTSTVNPFDRSRIYFHLDCLGESESIKSVKVELQTTDDSKTLVIPVTVLERQDATIHKLAARAMLDDLERGCSHIHLGPNRLVPNSWQETSMVRKEAEKIACKWSLVSKWTSFFLAEEPYRPTGGDPFMDGIVEVEASPGEDLLEPRGNIQHIAVLEPA